MNIAHPITDPYLRLKITCKNKTLLLRHSYVQDNIFNLDSNRKKIVMVDNQSFLCLFQSSTTQTEDNYNHMDQSLLRLPTNVETEIKGDDKLVNLSSG